MYFAIIASDKPFGVSVREFRQLDDPVFKLPEEDLSEAEIREKANVRVQAVINAVKCDRTQPGDAIFMIGDAGDNVVANIRKS